MTSGNHTEIQTSSTSSNAGRLEILFKSGRTVSINDTPVAIAYDLMAHIRENGFEGTFAALHKSNLAALNMPDVSIVQFRAHDKREAQS